MDSVLYHKIDAFVKLFSGFGAGSMSNVPLPGIVFMIFISLLCSLFISYLYLKFYESRATGSQIHRAFPLLGISITSIFICIQFSLPLSLGLLGALSIIRFRTPIKEPEEIGFIMLIVANAIACATFNLMIMTALLAIAVSALFILKYGYKLTKAYNQYGMIIITLPTDEYLNKRIELEKLMKSNFSNIKIDSLSNQKLDSTITYSFKAIQDVKNVGSIESKLIDIVKPYNLNILFGKLGTI